MNPLAAELNTVIEGTIAERLMSTIGKRIYFPKGIIAQSAEAKKSAANANATIGTAYSKGSPLILSAVAESMPGLNAEQAVAYAPTAGIEQIRKAWKDQILNKNRSLGPDNFSVPVVVPGLTSGLSCMADLFMPEEAVIIVSEPCWDNYSLIFEERRNGVCRGVPYFNGGSSGLNMDAIKKAVRAEAKKGTVRILLNFPNNPSGYSPVRAEADALAELFLKTAEEGADVLVLCDDAYFGLFYEDDIYKESLFSMLANLHPNIMAIKIDGPIKEDFTWGLRIGFVSFGSKGLDEKHYNALVTKLMGAIRSSVSCANTPAQHIILKSLEDQRTPAEKSQFQQILEGRYKKVKAFINYNPGHPSLEPMPFNSGYFMAFECCGISAEMLRRKLLTEHGIGVVALGDSCLRVAYCSLDEEKIDHVYRTIYDTAAGMRLQ